MFWVPSTRSFAGGGALRGSLAGGDVVVEQARARGLPRLRRVDLHLREREQRLAAQHRVVVLRALQQERRHLRARASIAFAPIVNVKSFLQPVARKPPKCGLL